MIDLYDFVSALNDASLPTDIINPSASGTAANIILQTWKVKKGQRFVTNFVLGEMGAGLPYSIGAALATGNRVIHIEGDGGFQLNIQELETIRRLNLPIIIFVINNNGYHSIRTSQMNAFGRVTGADDTSGVTLANLRSIASAYCFHYAKLADNGYYDCTEFGSMYAVSIPQNNFEWKSHLSILLNDNNQMLIEVSANPAQQYRHRIPSKLVDGKMTTAPMDEVK